MSKNIALKELVVKAIRLSLKKARKSGLNGKKFESVQ